MSAFSKRPFYKLAPELTLSTKNWPELEVQRRMRERQH
jgi:hypothetical protein